MQIHTQILTPIPAETSEHSRQIAKRKLVGICWQRPIQTYTCKFGVTRYLFFTRGTEKTRVIYIPDTLVRASKFELNI